MIGGRYSVQCKMYWTFTNSVWQAITQDIHVFSNEIKGTLSSSIIQTQTSKQSLF